MSDRASSVSGPVDRLANAAAGRSGDPGDRGAHVDIRAVAHLIPAAREACAALANSGRSLSRDRLAEAMRDNGHRVSNERASLLLKIVKAEHEVTTILPVPALASGEMESLPDVVV